MANGGTCVSATWSSPVLLSSSHRLPLAERAVGTAAAAGMMARMAVEMEAVRIFEVGLVGVGELGS